MKQIYNEGRVVGYSAYELYVRQQLSEDATSKLPTEREWLSTMFGSGNSMILKIASGTEAGVHDYQLPEGSQLAACSHISASVFTGTAMFKDDSVWAYKVNDYGALIRDTYTQYPVTPGQSEDVPYDISGGLSDHFKKSCINFARIADGIVFQPGTWTDYHQDGIEKEFAPNINERPIVRILTQGTIDSDLYVMLTGFLFKSVMSGTVGFDSAMETASPENGDFLGPMSYPWAVKITFVVSTDMQTVVNSEAYARKLPTSAEEKKVTAKPVIDFETSSPNTYYETNYSDAAIPLTVTGLHVPSGTADVLTLYQKDTRFNAGLYGHRATAEGDQKMYPIDTAAPGQIRVFTDEDKATEYPKTIADTYGLYKNADNHLFLKDADSNKIDISNDVDVTVNDDKYVASVTSGDDTIETVSLTNAVNGTEFNTSGARDEGTDCSTSVQSIDFLDWTVLLQALGKEKAIEVVGKLLKMYRDNIQFITDADGKAINTGSKNNYIEFSTSLNESGISSGKRLYISSTEPTGDDIPDGSIGIGW